MTQKRKCATLEERPQKTRKFTIPADTLSADMLGEVFKYLAPQFVVGNCSRVSKGWFHACKTNPISLFRQNLSDHQYRRVFSSESWSHLTELNLYTNDDHISDLITKMSHSPYMQHLRSLKIKYAHFDTDDIEKLLHGQYAASLTYLNLSHGLLRVGGELTPVDMPSLTHLNIAECYMYDDDVGGLISKMKCPLLNTLLISGNDIGALTLASLGKFPSITLLDISKIESDTESIVTELTSLKELRHLILDNLSSSLGAVAAVLSSSLSNQLVHLSANGQRGNTTLMGASHFPRLSHLSLNGAQITDKSMGDFLSKGQFPSIRQLSLSSNSIDECVSKSIAHNTTLSNLTALNLSHNVVSNEAVAILTGTPLVSSMKELNLHDNCIGPEGFSCILSSRYLSNLSLLVISCNPIQTLEKPREALLYNLRTLDASSCGLSDCFVENVLCADCFSGLTDLDLTDNAISDDGWARCRMRNLVSLKLCANLLSDRSVGCILTQDSSSLTELDLSWNGITNESFNTILSHCPGSKLKQLCLTGNGIDRKAAESLESSILKVSCESGSHLRGFRTMNKNFDSNPHTE